MSLAIFSSIWQKIKSNKIVTIFNDSVNVCVKAFNAAYVISYFENIILNEDPSILNKNRDIFDTISAILLSSFAIRAAYVYIKRKYILANKCIDIDDEFYFNRNLLTFYTYMISFDLISTFTKGDKPIELQNILPPLILAIIPATFNRLCFKMSGRDQSPLIAPPKWLREFDISKYKPPLSYLKSTAQIASTGVVYGGIAEAILTIHYYGIYGTKTPLNMKIIWGSSFMAVGVLVEACLILFKEPLEALIEKGLNFKNPEKISLSKGISKRILGRFTVALKTSIIYSLGVLLTASTAHGNRADKNDAWTVSSLEMALISLSSLYPAYLMQEELFRKRLPKKTSLENSEVAIEDSNLHTYIAIKEQAPEAGNEDNEETFYECVSDSTVTDDFYNSLPHSSSQDHIDGISRYGIFSYSSSTDNEKIEKVYSPA